MMEKNANATEIKCTDCGKVTTVPFKPTAGKPVYCRECLSKHRSNRAPEFGSSSGRTEKMTEEKQAWSRRREAWK
jgi:CxxC-x17-CxxC domain-containing protein